MSWIDWCITVIPIVFLLCLAVYARKYVRGVVDFLASGRVAGRYVIAVGGMETSLGVITLVALVEAKYQTGYAIVFWEYVTAPVGILFALTGYCIYRFRETKALSIGQFFEIRYNRAFRIFAATLRTVAEMLTNAIGPAVAANFFIYFMGFPHTVTFWGITMPTFAVLVAVVLLMALIVMWSAGRISLLLTDCMQGLMSYPVFVVIVGYIVLTFSWSNQIAPVMADRVAGESFLNPFDIENLRDFNIFALVVGLVGSTLNRASWIGNDTSSSGRTAHEQKMANILGSWRNGFSTLMCVLLAVGVITVMTHEDFAPQAREIRVALSDKVAAEVVADPAARSNLSRKFTAIPEQRHHIGVDKPLSRNKNLDTVYLDAAYSELGGSGEGNLKFQKFRTLYNQMMMPMAMRRMMPVGVMGIFGMLMLMLMLSTDDSRIFNSSSTIVQDVIVPLLKKPLTPKQHLLLLRLMSLAVCVLFFICALFFTHLDYINMFITIMTSVWLGGAGPVMIFGLYSRFGNTTGAFCSLIFGSGFSILGIVVQRSWAQSVYPFLSRMGWTDGIGRFLEAVSSPFAPYVVWHMDPVKFPINSYELYFMSMMSGLVAYVVGSLVAYRKPFNLEKMLHRGKYSIDGEVKTAEPFTWHNVWKKLIGITPEYTIGDKIIAWSVFGYTFIYKLGLCFIAVLIWNAFTPWPDSWWSHYFFVTSIAVAGIVGVVSTVWFCWGGIESVNMQLAQQYLAQFGNLAKTNNTMIIPSNLADVAGILQACSSVVKKA